MTLEVELPESLPEAEPADADGPDPAEHDDEPRRRLRRRGRRRRRSPWITIPVTVFAGLLAIAVLTPLTVGLRIWYQARQDERPRSDAIVVLGAAQYNGVPSPTLKWRLQHALDLYRRGVAPAIVTVGGKAPGDNFTEAGSGRDWLIAKGGVPAAKVVAVPVGRDTLESMKAVGKEFDRRHWSSAVIVTDPWHGLRSKKMAEDSGIKAAASPTRSGPSVQTRDTQFHYIVRETGGYLSYVLLGKSVKTPSETIKRIHIDPSATATPSGP
ncbi:YdcF family protein [Actinomadura decatromicini]|uniref:YdcF family protein n=1 Tax=Actinomadura decatromicini TaxID=2604572 RepID=A0A5D3FKB0_9ACTN|nr:YdcF family protein [Actinomadura decatromicini]TYK48130.1 YdcF family protein [Actinomadura decatromicini]